MRRTRPPVAGFDDGGRRSRVRERRWSRIQYTMTANKETDTSVQQPDAARTGPILECARKRVNAQSLQTLDDTFSSAL